MDTRQNYWTKRRFSRRAMLRGSGLAALGLTGAALLGCGDDDDDETGGTPSATSTSPGTAAATGTPVSNITRGGTLELAVTAEPLGSLNPHRGQGGGDHKFFWTMFEGLAQYNRRGEPDPTMSLAQEWEIVDPTTLRFSLRPGVKYHDGTEFKGEDVKYNFDHVLSEDYNSAARGQMAPIQEVEVVDDSTVVLRLDRPNAALITLLGDRGGQMISPTAMEAKGVEAFDRSPVGTGPYRFGEWSEESQVVVERNPDYWRAGSDGQALPYADKIRWSIIPDATVQAAGLQTGDIDVIAPSLSDLDGLESSGNFNITSFPGTGWSGMYFNTSLPPTDDVNFRRAIAYAIDREAENTAINFGRYQIASGIITPATAWAYPGPIPGAPTFDLEKARGFLAQSAYPDGAKFTTTISTSQAYATRGALWQDMLKKINIEMELIPLRTFTNRMWTVKDVNSLLAGFSLRADPDGTIGEVVHSKGFYNAGHAENAALDEAIEKARETYDLEERAELYLEVETILADQVYDVYSTYSTGYRVANKRIQNLASIWGAEGKERYDELWLDA